MNTAPSDVQPIPSSPKCPPHGDAKSEHLSVDHLRVFFASSPSGGQGHDAKILFGVDSPSDQDFLEFIQETSPSVRANILKKFYGEVPQIRARPMLPTLPIRYLDCMPVG